MVCDGGTGTVMYGDIASSGSRSSEEPQGRDFDDSSNALWSLYGKEAKSYDEATIQSLKGDMDGVLIFVRLYLMTFMLYCVHGRTFRLACSLRPSQRSLSIVLRAYKRHPHSNLPTSKNSLHCCLIRYPSSFPLSALKPPSLPIYRSQTLLSMRQHLTSG